MRVSRPARPQRNGFPIITSCRWLQSALTLLWPRCNLSTLYVLLETVPRRWLGPTAGDQARWACKG